MEEDKKYTDFVTVEMIGDENLFKFLNEMDTVVSNKIILDALKKAGRFINETAKGNFMSRKKNKSKTGYAGFSSMFKVQEIKAPDKVGVKVGISGREGYKYRWQNWGTVDRYYIRRSDDGTTKQQPTGRIQPTNFFTDAVATTQDQSQKIISESIIEALEKLAQENNANT
jgi:hypothetical protein